jgi:hypothetical protein
MIGCNSNALTGTAGVLARILRKSSLVGNLFVHTIAGERKIKDVMLQFLKGEPVSTTRITLPRMKFAPLNKLTSSAV